MKLKKVLAIFHITYFQGWSAVCSYYISLGISVKNIRNAKSKIKAPLDYKNVHSYTEQASHLYHFLCYFISNRGIQSKRHKTQQREKCDDNEMSKL